jgi:multidrug efflux pump subunit AcrB
MQTQPLLDSLIQGSSDRLRAVFLTTLTTVGGLLPLLFESSVQAQFLKPTVITLVYGLGMGMGLVLLMTPAMIAIANDLRRSWKAAVTAPQVIRRARNLARLRA